MKNLQSEALRRLPLEIKFLVRDGVYSLYTVSHPAVAFVLVTKRNERYPLSKAGDVVTLPEKDTKELRFDDVVAFTDLSTDQAVKVNYA